MYCKTKSCVKFLIFRATLLNLSIKALNVSSLSCLTLPTNWVEKKVDRVLKYFTEYGGRDVNHFKDGPLRVVGKAIHMMTSSVV